MKEVNEGKFMEAIEAYNIGVEANEEREEVSYYNAKILFVDDLEIIRHVMRRILHLINYKTIFFASNGQNALRMIQKAIKENKPFDMVITDINMGSPEDGGLPLCEAINNFEEFEKPAVAVCSGQIIDEIANSFEKAGVSHFLLKPFDMKEVKEFLSTILKKHFEKLAQNGQN